VLPLLLPAFVLLAPDRHQCCRCAAFYCELVKALAFSVGSHETLSELGKDNHAWEDPAVDIPVTDPFAGYDLALPVM